MDPFAKKSEHEELKKEEKIRYNQFTESTRVITQSNRIQNDNRECQKCKDTGMVKEKSGTIHVCYDCLSNGRLDVHSKIPKDSGLRI